MSISLTGTYFKGEYEKNLEVAINTQLTNVSADITTINTAISTLSGNITTLSGNITTLSGNITTLSGNITTLSGNITTISGNITTLSGNVTSVLDFTTVAEDATANFTLSLTTYRNFSVTNANTATKTLKIANVPTASDTMVNVNVKLLFSVTAAITYTGTITWRPAAPNPTAVGTFVLNLKSFDAGTNWLASYTGLY